MFKFTEPIRTHVKHLTELMEYANSRNDGKWAYQSSDPDHNGVYGAAYQAVEYIIREVCGQPVLDEINRSRYGYNWGGNQTRLHDVEVAIQTALDEIAEQSRVRCEWCGEECTDKMDVEMRAHKGCVLLNSDYGPDGR